MQSDFFSRPIWQQYLLGFMLFGLLFVFGYLFFIDEIQNQAYQQELLYQEKSTEIELLQARLARYLANDKTSLSLISEHELATAFESCHLTLNSFKYANNNNVVYWNIEIKGQFFDFIELMSYFVENYYYLDFQNLSIRQKDTQLKITFTLFFDNKFLNNNALNNSPPNKNAVSQESE